MRYELVNGYYTEIMFVKVGKIRKRIIPFPSHNARIVKNEGTKLSKEHLKNTIGQKEYDKL